MPPMQDERRRFWLHSHLSKAAIFGDVKVARYWLGRGAEVNNPRNPAVQSPLFQAAQHGDWEMVELFREAGAKIGPSEAAILGETEILRGFLDRGLPVETITTGWKKPLIAAAAYGGHLETVRLLAERGADAAGITYGRKNPPPPEGLLPSDSQSSMDLPDSSSRTPLMHAIWRGQLERVRQYLDLGADPRIADHNGVSGLNLIEGWMWRNGFEIQSLLLERGLDVDTQDNEGMTPLMRAARFGYDDLVQLYLEHGADRAVRNAKGDTALDLAGDHLEALALLSG